MEEKKAEPRYVGLDFGKKTYEMAIVGKGGKVTLSNGKTFASDRQKLYKKLRATDKVALEAGNMAFIVAKEIQAAVAGCKVYVLNAGQLAIIYASMRKTDKEDALKLAHILQDFNEERLPVVTVPNEKTIEYRKLIASHRRASQSRNREINLLHALFVSQGITTVVRKDLASKEKRQEAITVLTGLEREEAEHLLELIDIREKRISALEKQRFQASCGDEDVERLQSVPGVGPLTALAFVAHVDAQLFENAGQVSNYLGLVPRVYMSGETVRYGRITKRGNGYLRALLVQASWALIRSNAGGKLKERYAYMTQEKSTSKKKTIVAIARRLSEMLYVMLRDKTWYAKRPFIHSKENVERLTQLALSA